MISTEAPNKKFIIINIILSILLFYFLDFLYVRDISVVFESEGYKFEPSVNKSIFSYTLLLITLAIIYFSKLSGFINAVVFIFVALLLVPNLLLYKYMTIDPAISLGCVLFIVFIGLFSKWKMGIKHRIVERKHQIWVLALIIMIALVPFFITFGFNLRLDSFYLGDEVYEVRYAAREKYNMFTAYSYSWLTNILLPILLVMSIKQKNYILLGFAIVAIVYLFLCNAMKSVLISIPFLILFYFGEYVKKASLFLVICVSVCFINVLVPDIFISVFINRTFYITALLNHYYFDFFDNNSIHLSSSIFRSFIDYPYAETPARLIGKEYFGKSEMNANNGFPADAFMNFGYIGIFIFAALVALIFSYLNSLKLSNRYFGVIFISIGTIISSEFFTALMTHGILLLLLVSSFLLKKSGKYELIN